ncbi:helix-hairpin-helix domain-containing protein [Roseofilum sp. BLCC_M154]|uniref:Helix-hairpin-helix domain-containing protein n=1 Tax=Roseofilum acuticapitatum BLCC-M154 TaxID=3022444 RepID=A0ABT7AZ58_9CYAN|nr:helix-hairpin-helix domain-containing protein [Roseofilum acuticapitatum]MDJ1172200.1 helix-hairpin-helix domain-containing protein [Roseofilum acuticapitatum BLCC-M154]
MAKWNRVIQILKNQLRAILPNPTPRRFLNPYYRFQSLEEVALAAQCGVTIDVNQATVDDWLRLPFFSIHQARFLVSLRQAGVQFYRLEDLAAALELPVEKLRPIEPILQFCYYDWDLCWDVNQVSLPELLQVPFMERSLAEAIITQRNQQGEYQDWLDFQRRLGLSGEEISALLPYLRFVVSPSINDE